MAQNTYINKRIRDLRGLLVKKKLDAYYIPSNDEYLSIFCNKDSKRLEYITGFSGSNGIAFITQNQVLLLTDSRYIEQAKVELSDLPDAEIIDLKENFDSTLFRLEGKIIGYDPALITLRHLKVFNTINFQPVLENLVDILWQDKPLKVQSKIYEYKNSGMHCMQKLQNCYSYMKNNQADYLFISDVCSINWLLNIRAQDLEHVPVLLCYLLIGHNQIYLFCYESYKRFKNFIHSEWHLDINYYDTIQMPEIISTIAGQVIIDFNNCPINITSCFKNANLINKPNIILDFKACKNEAEIALAVSGHVQDAQSLCEVFAFILQEKNIGKFTEQDVGHLAQKARYQHKNYICESFKTICGYKSNAAIVHYNPYKNPLIIDGSGVLLIDTGAQYLGCTTDVTRTFFIQTKDFDQQLFQEIKHAYTLVLKGHVALAKARFPYGAHASYLDNLARQFLYNEGLNYGHSTGHGVGSFLEVHEAPPTIAANSNSILKKGMIFSNEPGYYKNGFYGIRIENLCLVVESNILGFLELQQLTLLPYCFNLIKWDLITLEEAKYLKKYYIQIQNQILPKLNEDAFEWCKKELDLALQVIQ